ncbi:DNA2/nam7 helicase family [Anaeramoeba ignava]|uniref:DNA2/nam7 helicase family n=1 Tax=Anaeramoeba ignava TaxID=1746090 RepID=A0A9Q0LCG3_ANAIG|nr:DNA2/nam7 helicase family [Anaeramoeba ignava]
MLRTQYRCHPLISQICNNLFYQGALLDGISSNQRKPIVNNFPPLFFLDSENGKEEKTWTGSYRNFYEAKIIIGLIEMLLKENISSSKIGVITLYKEQARLINKLLTIFQNGKSKSKSEKEKKKNKKEKSTGILGLKNTFTKRKTNNNNNNKKSGKNEMKQIQISTVDAFQGAEKEICIVSCCRTENLGFIESPNRLNVLLSRAKNHLIIVGRQKVLNSSSVWNSVIKHCIFSMGGICYASDVCKNVEILNLKKEKHFDLGNFDLNFFGIDLNSLINFGNENQNQLNELNQNQLNQLNQLNQNQLNQNQNQNQNQLNQLNQNQNQLNQLNQNQNQNQNQLNQLNQNQNQNNKMVIEQLIKENDLNEFEDKIIKTKKIEENTKISDNKTKELLEKFLDF